MTLRIPSKYHDRAAADGAVEGRGTPRVRRRVVGRAERPAASPPDRAGAPPETLHRRRLRGPCKRESSQARSLLAPGHYLGIDIAQPLLDGYANEIVPVGLANCLPVSHLAVTPVLDVGAIGATFDFGIAKSVFTHLPRTSLTHCLRALRPSFRRAASSSAPGSSRRIRRPTIRTGGRATGSSLTRTAISFTRAFEIVEMAHAAGGWRLVRIGDWGHPRAQQMLALRPDLTMPRCGMLRPRVIAESVRGSTASRRCPGAQWLRPSAPAAPPAEWNPIERQRRPNRRGRRGK